jgi:diguanylate cyclase (GGDEF)-like protein
MQAMAPRPQVNKERDAPSIAPERSRARARPERTSPEAAADPSGPTPTELLAEVDRLSFELQMARDEVRRLSALADEDPLCGILNRRGFEREMRRTLAHCARYGTVATLLLVDLDDFKHINDTKGHAAGDEVLRAFARGLSRSLRGSDVLARIGGDEFAIILWHCSPDNAPVAASRLLKDLPIPACAGAAPIEGRDLHAIFARADEALYAMKRERRVGGEE